ncbi:MAG: flagellar hook-associated protein FlgK [Pseudomonadota bacterium]
MADFLSTTVSGLSTVQRALDVLSHNVANAYTEGYTRQNVVIATRTPQETGQGAVGTGSALTDISRTFDQFLGQTLQGALSEQGRLGSRDLILGQMDEIVSADENNLSSRLTTFFNSAQDVANAPSDLAVRTAFLGEARTMAQQIQAMDRRLADVEGGLVQRAMRVGGEINEMTSEIAKLNETILDSRRRFPDHQPNDLLDRRDLLLRNLAEKVDIKTYEDGDGNINISIGSGQSLVNAERATPVGVGNTSAGLSIHVGNSDVTNLVSGGELGGLMRVKEEELEPRRAELGRMVFSFATRFNEVHGQGVDMDGNAGTATFFNVTALNTPVAAEPKVSPPAFGVSVSITDVTQLTANDYTLKYEGSQWNLYKSGQSTAIQSPVAASPIALDGVEITYAALPNPPAAGDPDRIAIRPMAGEMSSLAVNVGNAREIAAAAVGEGPGDNSNMLKLTAISTETNVVQGSMSLTEAFTVFIADFGAEARGVSVSLEAQQLVVKQTEDRLQSVVGVNLDEEAANLMRLQNHYLALSKSMSIGETLFQSLLQAAS